MSAYKRIIVGTDGSDTALHAVARAAAIAADTSAEPALVTAYEPERREVVKEARDALQEKSFVVLGAAPADAMLRAAAARKSGVDALIVHTS